MSVRTIIEIELGRSNPRFETVALLAEELNISLDAGPVKIYAQNYLQAPAE